MSGSLASLFDSLFTSSFRGVEFEIPQGDREAGRRLQPFAFPGRDGLVHQDLGGISGRLTISGVIIGADYVRRAAALERAFNTPGPGTLVHPWYGELVVVLAEPCRIAMDERSLRFARFDAVFEPWIEQPAAARDTFGELLARCDELRSQARAYLRRLLAPVRLSLAASAAVRSMLTGLANAVRGVLRSLAGGGNVMQGVLRSSLGGLDALAAGPSTAYSADSVFVVIAAVPAAAGTAGIRPARPLIAPGGGATDPAAQVDAAVAADMLLRTAARLPMATATPPAVQASPATQAAQAAQVAARCLCLAEACAVAGSIDYPSRADAEAWRARLMGAIEAASADAATVALADPEAAGPVWRGLQALRSAVAADMHERIGRLPRTQRMTTPPARLPAWVIAQHVAGDDPTRVLAVVRDLVARNSIGHPSAVPPETEVEWLP